MTWTATRRRSVSLITFALGLALGCALTPGEVWALELEIAPTARFSMAELSDGDGGESDPGLGLGFGAQLPVLLMVHPSFGVGPVFDFSHHSHGEDIATGEATTTLTLPTAGVMVRWDVASFLGAELWGGYTFGVAGYSANVPQGDDLTADYDVSGFQVGLEVFYRCQLDPYRTWLEVGPSVAFHGISFAPQGEPGQAANDVSYLTFGLAAQATFALDL